MRSFSAWPFLFATICISLAGGSYQKTLSVQNKAKVDNWPYLGFDRNDYPGDDALSVLRKSFSFAGYWLSAPPGGSNNSWAGKRTQLRNAGFGFLLLYRGRTSSEISTEKKAKDAGLTDAQAAAAAARRDGFAPGSVIFLDEEEGGRYFPTQHLYLRTWAETLAKEHFRPGIYCSGIPVDEGEGSTVVTSDDIRAHIGVADVVYWVYNDACPPSPGCGILETPSPPLASGVKYAKVWQYVRSPREKKVTRRCHGYASDGNCYALGDAKHQWFLDMNVALMPDPSAPQ